MFFFFFYVQAARKFPLVFEYATASWESTKKQHSCLVPTMEVRLHDETRLEIFLGQDPNCYFKKFQIAHITNGWWIIPNPTFTYLISGDFSTTWRRKGVTWACPLHHAQCHLGQMILPFQKTGKESCELGLRTTGYSAKFQTWLALRH